MTRLVPHPVLSLILLIVWLMLTRFSPGFLVLGTALALVAGKAYSSLHSPRPRLRRLGPALRLAWLLFRDIVWSNLSVARHLLRAGRDNRQPAFLRLRLTVTNPNALALLSIILTATPGTAWLEYRADTGILLLHLLDGSEAARYSRVIRTVYEPLLLEIFE